MGNNHNKSNSIQEEIKSRLKSENAYKHSVQNRLSFSLLSKNLKIKIYIYIYIYDCNFAHCCVWVWNLVANIEGGM